MMIVGGESPTNRDRSSNVKVSIFQLFNPSTAQPFPHAPHNYATVAFAGLVTCKFENEKRKIRHTRKDPVHKGTHV
jgi:hypothetical protein